MSHSPMWKCFRDGQYEACTKSPEDAAILMAAWGDGSIVKFNHGTVVWQEGKEAFPAGESYDRAADLMHERRRTYAREAFKRFPPNVAI